MPQRGTPAIGSCTRPPAIRAIHGPFLRALRRGTEAGCRVLWRERAPTQLGKPVAAVNLGRTRADELLTLKVSEPCVEALATL